MGESYRKWASSKTEDVQEQNKWCLIIIQKKRTVCLELLWRRWWATRESLSVFSLSLSVSLSLHFSPMHTVAVFLMWGRWWPFTQNFVHQKFVLVQWEDHWYDLYSMGGGGGGGGVGVGVERERKKNGTVLPQNLWANITFSVQWWSLRAVSGCHNDSFGYGPVVGESGSILHMTCIPRSNCLCQWPWAYLDGLFGSVFLGQVILVT